MYPKAIPTTPRRRAHSPRRYLDWLREQPSCVSGQEPCEAAHIVAAVSLKTNQALARRSGVAMLAAVPLTPEEHRTAPDSLHALGEAGFEQHRGWPAGHLQRLALTYLATYISQKPGGKP